MHDASTRTRGERSTAIEPALLNDDSRDASAGSLLARCRSISARMRCSSMESAMAPPPHTPAEGWMPLLSPVARFLALFTGFRSPESPPFPSRPAARPGHARPRRAPGLRPPARESNWCLTRGNTCSIFSIMRWDAIRIQGGGPGTPALFERDAVARTFDTPGFRGMTFFEVHARSVINRVPEASRMPFRWTINPYRGCSHACSYCLAGETPILMADGRARPLADVQVGDAIYGTVWRGQYRRYVRTTVLAHWQAVKPAYLTTLEDGTELIT